MSDELDVLKLVAQHLDAAGIAYMLSGSMALSYYARPRLTRDIDVVVEVRATDVERLASLFQADFYCDPDMIREAVQHEGMFNVIHNASIIKVDFIVRKHSPYRHAEFQRRRAVEIDGDRLWIVAPEDLVLSKLVWAKEGQSTLQLDDVRNVMESVENLDWDYLRHWARELTVDAMLDEVQM